MQIEHGLITVSQAADTHGKLPENTSLFVEVDGTLRKVKGILSNVKRGLEVAIVTPTGNRRVGVKSDDLLVISFDDLAGCCAEDVKRRSRRTMITNIDTPKVETGRTIYSGVHCG